MKKILLFTLILIFTFFTISAATNDLSDRNLELSFNLTTDEESPSDPAWVRRTIGFTDNLKETSFDGDTVITPITALPLEARDSSSDDAAFELVGEGSCYIYWQILSPEKITATISAEALTLDGKETVEPRETINWRTQSWTKQGQTEESLNKAVTIDDASLSLGDDNYDAKEVFVHDGSGKALASYGYVKLDITTLDAAGNKAGNYSADITLTLKTDEA